MDWDKENIAHIARHNVTPQEVEEVFSRLYLEFEAPPVEGEPRTKIQGSAASARFLTVIYTERAGKIRPVTAYDMSRKDRKLYASQILNEQ